MLTEFQNKGLLAQEVIFSNAVASEARKELGPEWENKIKKYTRNIQEIGASTFGLFMALSGYFFIAIWVHYFTTKGC